MYLHENWTFQEKDAQKWYPASVPGCVHTDLLDNGLIDDPFYRDNEDKLQWIENADWDYRTSFHISPEQLEAPAIELVFEGLDTFAEVVLNDTSILQSDNMFRTWRIDVLSHLRPGSNDLVIRFRSPIKEIKPLIDQKKTLYPTVTDYKATSTHTRKAPYHFGWDWGPRFVTSGLWRPVYLLFHDVASIENVQIIQDQVSPEKADLTINIDIKSTENTDITLRISDTENSFAPITHQLKLKAGPFSHSLSVSIQNPELWWPNGLGEPNLYHLNFELLHNDVPVDFKQERIGLRSLELRQNPDEHGKSFAFIINKVPVFAKGGNWIPADSFLDRVDEDVYSHFIHSCVDANMNMLRVWGGGVYEDDLFYELCDEAGIMVWQDFMFACSMHPADKDFLASFEQEAIDNIKRLRNHPSIVLWCGNNENETGWQEWGWSEKYSETLWHDYEKLFHDLLPKICAKHDPTRAYWPSSPSSGGEAFGQDQGYGDIHYWDVWHGSKPFTAFRELTPRFISEYGFQSLPDMAAINSFTLPEDQHIDSQTMQVHQKHIISDGYRLIQEYMLRDYAGPRDFEAYVYLSQVLQAEGMKTGTEHFRRLMPHCMGTLYWQINDCWPVTSWASMDYYGSWKALHYFARHFYNTILVSMDDHDDILDIYVVSDKTKSVSATLQTRLYDLSGNVLTEENETIEITPLASKIYQTIPLRTWQRGNDPHTTFIKSDVIIDNEIITSNRYYFVPVKELALEKPVISTEITRSDSGFFITLVTNTLAKNVYLTVRDDNGFFTDNFMDLQPNEPIKLEYLPENPLYLYELQNELDIKSLTDAC